MSDSKNEKKKKKTNKALCALGRQFKTVTIVLFRIHGLRRRLLERHVGFSIVLFRTHDLRFQHDCNTSAMAELPPLLSSS